ncbi:hypothetical protein GCM10023091_28080 [Ravibacter arvi]|uniref:Lipocalin-like domain-containing protein n=2 Tax=Ravibacter arvi TaxID=2051041 RepID=A0ABP8M3E7_9BACT
MVTLLTAQACRKKEVDHETAPFAGVWRLTSVWDSTAEGGNAWRNPAESDHFDRFVFRSDGVLVDEEGEPLCCVPNVYLVDGARFTVVPDQKQTAPRCAHIDCITCEYWTLTRSENTLEVSGCEQHPFRYRFERM